MIAPHELIIASADLVVAAAEVVTAAASAESATTSACEGFWQCLVDWKFWMEGSGNVSEVIRNISIIAGFVIGGLVGFGLAFVRTRASWWQGVAAISGHITDRYAKAVEQLGNKESLHVRLGGIYALAHVGRDEPEYRDTVLDVLCAFIRTQKPEGIGADNDWIEKAGGEAGKELSAAKAATTKAEEREYPPAPPDVRAALDVVVKLNPEARNATRRRNSLYRTKEIIRRRFGAALLRVAKWRGRTWHQPKAGLGLPLSDRTFPFKFGDPYVWWLDLRGAYLVGVEQRGAFLGNAHFGNARIDKATFAYAHLQGAVFSSAFANGAEFENAHLDGAFFVGTRAKNVNFRDTQLNDADFSNSRLSAADFRSAQLKSACFIGTLLDGVDFTSTQLSLANFLGANLYDARFQDAVVDGADFSSASLGGMLGRVSGLTQAQIDSAYGDDRTRLPEGLNPAFKRRTSHQSASTSTPHRGA